MTKKVPATCPDCGANELNLSMVQEGKVVSLAGYQMKVQLTAVPQLWCNNIGEGEDGWMFTCSWEQNGYVDKDGYAAFGKLEKTDA